MAEELSFGAWLRRCRKARDLTQAELAQRVGCAEGSIRHLEADEQRPSKQLAQRLAAALEVEPDDRAAFVAFARGGSATALPAPRPALERRADHDLPTGTVTFLFADIEDSTKRWEQHPQAMPEALAQHNALIRAAIETHGGTVFRTVGDAVCAAFASATDALAAALAAQRALQTAVWGASGPLLIRMAVHTGVVEAAGADYQGLALSRIARLLSAGHGGQILLSRATQELVREQLPSDVELRDLGEHRLKDLTHPEQIFQLSAPDLPSHFPPLTTLGTHRTNLPVEPTALIGRTQEVRRVAELLRQTDVRLVTLTGPGGVGKTRLGLQVAAELLDTCVDGVWFVDLAPIRDPTLVASAIAQTVGVKETGSQSLLDTLKAYLQTKQLLLLLDNFEQVLAAAPLVAELLSSAAGLKVLITSRAVLHLAGEHEFGVLPLSLPDPGQLPSLERLRQYEAVRLFIARAQAVKADFAVTNANAPAVAEICHRLDGLPLAIELAAVRLKLFAPEALLKRLEQRLPLLIGGARDLPARQQTLRAAIDWSYQLLDAAEQTLFRRLAVFVGGCTLEAAGAVCNAESDLLLDVLEGLTTLVDKSLLRQEAGVDGEPRFTMLETIREYVLERLEESGEPEALRRLYATYYLTLAKHAEPKLRSAEQAGWVDRLTAELDNLRATLGWVQLDSDSSDLGLHLAGALFWFWYLHGDWNEGRRWLSIALTLSGGAPTVAQANALRSMGALAFYQVDYAAASTYLEEGLTLFRELGDHQGRASSLGYLGDIAGVQGDHMRAKTLIEEGLALFREIGDRWGQALLLKDLGMVAWRQGDPARAMVLLEEGLALFRELGDRWGQAQSLLGLASVAHSRTAWEQLEVLSQESLAICRGLGYKRGIGIALLGLGMANMHRGDVGLAQQCYQDSLRMFRVLGDKAGIARNLQKLMEICEAQGQLEWAARLAGAAQTLYDSIDIQLPAIDWIESGPVVANLESRLGEAQFAVAWVEGQALTLEQAITYALAGANASPDRPVDTL